VQDCIKFHSSLPKIMEKIKMFVIENVEINFKAPKDSIPPL